MRLGQIHLPGYNKSSG